LDISWKLWVGLLACGCQCRSCRLHHKSALRRAGPRVLFVFGALAPSFRLFARAVNREHGQ
jgi:hypothetical protein